MNAFLRVIVGPFCVLVPRDGIVRVETVDTVLTPLPPRMRAARPMIYVDAARLLGVESAAGQPVRTALHLFPTESGLEWQVLVDRVERIETHAPGDFRPLPPSLSVLRRFVDGVLVDSTDSLALRLRPPSAMPTRGLIRQMRRAALGAPVAKPAVASKPHKKKGAR